MQTYTDAISALQKAIQEHPQRAATVRLYVHLLALQQECAATVSWPPGALNEALARLKRGDPLLAPNALAGQSAKVAEVCDTIAATTAEHRTEIGQSVLKAGAWLGKQGEGLATLTARYLAGEDSGLALEDGIDESLVWFVLGQAMHPFLRSAAGALHEHIDGSHWYRGICPVCGGAPDMAALEQETGSRRLLCSRCDMEWPFYRAACPFCAEEGAVAYYTASDAYRLYVCEACGRYLKTVDLREASTARPLAAERVLSIGLDISARRAGWV